MRNDKIKRPRFPRGVLVLTSFIGLSLSLAVVAVADGVISGGGSDPEIAEHERAQRPATARVKVGDGTLPRNGRFELYRSTTAAGEVCFGIMLFNQPDAVRGVLFEGCGNPSDTSIGSNGGNGETIIYGRVPKNADKIEIDVAGKGKKVFTAKDSYGDVPMKYFVTAYEGKLTRATAKVKKADASEIATQDVPLSGE